MFLLFFRPVYWLIFTYYLTARDTGTTHKKMKTQTTTEKLVKFVNQRPGLDFCNYGDISSYRSESREITRDRSDFFELFTLAASRVDNLDEQLTATLSRSSGRLTLNDSGNLEYITGQYFPTEYRPAACRILRDIIWASYRDEKNSDGSDTYKDGHELRKAIRRRVSRRVAKYYFN